MLLGTPNFAAALAQLHLHFSQRFPIAFLVGTSAHGRTRPCGGGEAAGAVLQSCGTAAVKAVGQGRTESRQFARQAQRKTVDATVRMLNRLALAEGPQ